MKSGMLIASVFLLVCVGAVGLATASPITGTVALQTAAARPSGSIESVPMDLRPVMLQSLVAHDQMVAQPFFVNSVWVGQPVTQDGGGFRFGLSVAIDSAGTTALIAAPDIYSLSQPGYVYVFTKSGSAWSQSQILSASDGAPGDRFGQSVAISGGTAVISSVRSDGLPEAVYIFTSSGGPWTEQQKLTASDGVPGDQFGISVAIDGPVTVVGSYATVGGNAYQGAAYVFTEQNDAWTQTQKLIVAEGVANDIFGQAVAVRGSTIVVGSVETSVGHFQGGAAYVFEESGGTWQQVQRLTNEADVSNRASFGSSLAMDDDTLIVGAYGQVVDSILSGAVYVFSRTDGMWSQSQVLAPSDGQFLGLYGISVAFDGGRIIVGADNQNPSPVGPGAAYIYSAVDGIWTLDQELSSNAGVDFSDHFGVSVALAGESALVGADNVETAYFYSRQQAPPVANIAPASLIFEVPSGSSGSTPLSVGNSGELDLTWAIAERPATLPRSAKMLNMLGKMDTSAPSGDRRFGVSPANSAIRGRDLVPWAPRTPEGNLSFILDDGSYNNTVSLNDGAVEFAAIYLNRFTPPTGTGSFIVDSIVIGWPTNANGTLIGKQVNLLAYYDADGDGDPSNAARLGGDNLVTIESLDTFVPYTVNLNVPGEGDIYIGFESSYAIGGSTPILYPAALDTTVSQGHSWAIASTTGPGPNPDDLSDNEIMGTTDSFGFPGNWMIRATGTGGGGCSAPSDVPWLSETPANGMVAGAASQDVVVTVDATGLSPGTYSAVLCITTNDLANSVVQIPVSLTVTADVSDAIFQDGFDSAP
jgi:hypothetical protein